MSGENDTAYRGVQIPDDLRGALSAWKRGVDSALDRTGLEPAMSPDVARLVLDVAANLYAEGLSLGSGEVDEDAVVRKAADVIGRDRIKDRDTLNLLAELDGGGRK